MAAGEGRARRKAGAAIPAALLAAAGRLEAEFVRRTAGLTYESQGLLFSELLFLWAAAEPLAPRRLVESGRARAQSTAVLARLFPGARLFSIEREPQSPDAVFGATRLAGLANVELVAGDAREILPRLVEPGDAVLLDGPKSYRALHLALDLLAERRPALIFIHDCCRGQPERALLERLLPEAAFSDAPEFVRRFAPLDEPCWARIREGRLGHWRPHSYAGRPAASYGPTLACLFRDEGRDYRGLAAEVARAGFGERVKVVKRKGQV